MLIARPQCKVIARPSVLVGEGDKQQPRPMTTAKHRIRHYEPGQNAVPRLNNLLVLRIGIRTDCGP